MKSGDTAEQHQRVGHERAAEEDARRPDCEHRGCSECGVVVALVAHERVEAQQEQQREGDRDEPAEDVALACDRVEHGDQIGIDGKLDLDVAGAVAAPIDLGVGEGVAALVVGARDRGGVGLAPGVLADQRRVDLHQAQDERDGQDRE